MRRAILLCAVWALNPYAQAQQAWPAPAPAARRSAALRANAASASITATVSPNSGTGPSQSFAFDYRDSAGASDLFQVYVWITANLTLGNEGATCLLLYSPATQQLDMYNDAGTGFLPTTPLGAPGMLANSQCGVNPQLSSATSSGTDLVLTLPISFSATFTGAKNIYVYAAGSGADSGWQQVGSWTATEPPPQLASLSPNSAASGSGAVSLTLDGATLSNADTIQWASPGGAQATLPASLINAAQLQAVIPSTLLTSPGIAQVAITSASSPGSNSLPFLISNESQPAPVLTSLSPDGAPQGSQTITVNANGSGFQSGASLWWVAPGGGAINLPATFVSSAQLQASVPGNLMTTAGTAQVAVLNPSFAVSSSEPFLVSGGGSPATLSSVSPLTLLKTSTNAVLTANGSNIQNGASLWWTSQAGMTANLPATFVSSAQFTAAIPSNLLTSPSTAQVQILNPNSTLSAPQTVAIVNTSAPVQTLSVNPSSGGGNTQTFTFNYVDSAGAVDLSQVYVWFNPTLPSGYAPASCLMYYDRAARQLYLYNDAGTAWLPGTVLGLSTELENSQCYVSSAFAVSNGPLLSLTLSMTFLPSFAGSKNIYMNAVGGAGNSGWQTMGSWTTTGVPSLQISLSHTGNFVAGQQNVTYTAGVVNQGSWPSSGTMTVTENLPPGLSLVSMSGQGWSCSRNTCARSDSLPPYLGFALITIRVNVAANAASPQVNSVSVSGGGSPPASATDPTTITAPLALSYSCQQSGFSSFGVLWVGTPVSIGCTVSGGTPGYTWFSDPAGNSLTSSVCAQVQCTLPPGLTLSTTGATLLISGTPSGPGQFVLGYAVTDSGSPQQRVEVPLSLAVSTPITSLSPSQMLVTGSGFTLTVNGLGFLAPEYVEWNGQPILATVQSPTQLTAFIPANLIASPGQVTVQLMWGQGADSTVSQPVPFPVTIPVPTPQAWTQISSSNGAPSARGGSAAVFDAGTSQAIVFGGAGGSNDYNDVWGLTLGGSPFWGELGPSAGTLPPARAGATAVSDSSGGNMIMFGGGLGSPAPCANDVWVWSSQGEQGAPSWVSLSPVGSPPAARIYHSAIYDQTSNRMIVFGGNNCLTTGAQFYNDVWVLTNATGYGGPPTWSQLAPSGTPPDARSNHTAVYDPSSNRMILFGGAGNGTVFDDVWVLTNANGLGGTPQWIHLTPGGSAIPPTAGHVAAYLQGLNRMVVFSGGSSTPNSNTWALLNANGLGGSPVWTQLSPAGTPPSARSQSSAVYDATFDRMIVFGGISSDGITPLNDTWILTGVSNIQPTISSLSPTNSPSGGLPITVQVGGANISPYATVLWTSPDGTQTTVYADVGNSSQLGAEVPAALLTSPGIAQVAIVNPGNLISGSLPYLITSSTQVPVLTSLTPNQASPGTQAATITASGSGFQPGASLWWTTPGGATINLPANFISSAQLQATVSANLLTTAGTAQVAVLNPSFGLSAVQPFFIATPSATFVPGAITSPSPGSMLAGSLVTFQWTPGTGTANLYWLRVGTTGVGSYDIADDEYAQTSVSVSGIPALGETVYVRLSSLDLASNTWVSNDYTYTASISGLASGAPFSPAAMTSPSQGSTLGGSTVTFQWSAGTGSTSNLYWLKVGTTGVGSSDVSANEYSGTSATVSGIPANGETVYVRLMSPNPAADTWVSNDYTYTAADLGSAASFVPAAVTSPGPGSTLSGSTATFTWSAGTGTGNGHWLRVGTTGVGSYDICDIEYSGSSATVSGIPTNGGTVYVQLYSLNPASNTWVPASYTYTAAASSSGSGSSFVAAAIASPSQGSTLSGSTATFTWNAGTGTGNAYWLRVGTTGMGSYDISDVEYAGTSATVSGIPMNGGPVYATLYSLNPGTGAWVPASYTYTAGLGSGSSFAPAAITSPSQGSTLSGSTVTFTWSAATGAGNGYWLRVGTTGAASYDISDLEYSGTSATVSGIPTNGGTVYVTLYSLNPISNTWVPGSYTYTAGLGSGSSFVPAAITSPSQGSALSGSTVTFTWSAATGAGNGYWLRVGTTGAASYDVSDLEYSGTSATVSGIPTNGGTVYLTLYSLNPSSNTWVPASYTYTAAASGSGSGSSFVPAAITGPSQGSTLSGSTATFTWNAGTGTGTGYWLRVGTTGAGSYDISDVEYAGTSATVSGLPTNGSTVYVRLYSLNPSTGVWVSNDYNYTAF